MKKKILIPVIAGVAAAGIAAGVFFGVFHRNKVEPFESVQKFNENVLFSSSFEENETVQAPVSKAEGSAVNVTAKKQSGGDSPMTTAVSNGPEYHWGGMSRTGWTGDKALKINGVHKGHADAFCANVLFEGLNLPVTKDTHLSYVIYPSTLSNDSYDYEYTGTFLAVDAVFTDGTKLSDLHAVDQNGFLLDPVSQGQSDALYTNQWNFIRADIGSVAAGKTIDRLLVSYQKPDNNNAGDSEFLAYLDDVSVSDITGMEYDHLADYVNIFRGSNSTSEFSRGLIAPAVTMPNGFNFFTPTTDAGDKLMYYYQLSGKRTTLSSISIQHIASYWVGYYGSWQFMPSTQISASSAKKEGLSASSRAATFSHNDETGTCYYYGVTFADDSVAAGVKAEVTPTMYGAVARFTFPEGSDNATLVFDSENGGGTLSFGDDNKTLFATSNDKKQGARMMNIYAEFDTAFESSKSFGERGAVTFPQGTKTVTMTLATSFMSKEQAKKNYDLDFAESKDFDKVCAVARKTWDDTLGLVEIEGATFAQKVTYYSCLYRANAYPNLYRENTGTAKDPVWQYASPYSTSAKALMKDGALVCNTGLWDTYRTAWPWSLTASKDPTLINGLLAHYTDSGWNGAWVVVKASQIMIGTHTDIVYADAMKKGVDFDLDTAMESMLRNAASTRDRGGVGREEQETGVFTGYTSNDTPRGLSWTLDNALNDYGIYVMAEKLGMQDEAAYYKNRAKAYVNVYNADAGFYIGKDKNGVWSKTKANYDPTEWLHDYTESNGWDMAFNMVYDAGGMASLYGGIDRMAAKLDQMFATPIKNVSGDSIHEVREGREVRLGQYIHSNQVAHHLAYMYDFCDQPYKTQEKVRSILARCYVGAEIGQGYIGDEDNGEQSAWYVYSALGFYPTALATGQYTIGSPLFEKATLHLATGDVTITAHNNSTENIYIASCTVNGEPWNKPYLTQEMLDHGADIVFEMTNQPTAWGTGIENLPYSLTPYGEQVDYKTDTTKNATVNAGVSAKALTDDTSETVVSFGKSAAITLSYEAATKIQIVTLTSGKEPLTIDSYTLEASADGVNWTTLDTRENLSFAWMRYTRPFLIPADKQGAYTQYRITLTGSKLALSELELIEA